MDESVGDTGDVRRGSRSSFQDGSGETEGSGGVVGCQTVDLTTVSGGKTDDRLSCRWWVVLSVGERHRCGTKETSSPGPRDTEEFRPTSDGDTDTREYRVARRARYQSPVTDLEESVFPSLRVPPGIPSSPTHFGRFVPEGRVFLQPGSRP